MSLFSQAPPGGAPEVPGHRATMHFGAALNEVLSGHPQHPHRMQEPAGGHMPHTGQAPSQQHAWNPPALPAGQDGYPLGAPSQRSGGPTHLGSTHSGPQHPPGTLAAMGLPPHPTRDRFPYRANARQPTGQYGWQGQPQDSSAMNQDMGPIPAPTSQHASGLQQQRRVHAAQTGQEPPMGGMGASSISPLPHSRHGGLQQYDQHGAMLDPQDRRLSDNLSPFQDLSGHNPGAEAPMDSQMMHQAYMPERMSELE